ncbi:MAG: hypothetical protein ACR2N6_09525 [Miltoncostaeaceae bacterium]
MIRRLSIAALIALVGLAGLGLWLWSSARSSTEVQADDAVIDFRERAGAAGAPGKGVPSPGVYTYRQEGEETVAIGPAELTRELPSRAVYVAALVPGGFQEDLQLSEEHVESVRFRPEPSGALRATWRRTEVSVLAVGRDDTRDLRPPALYMPATLRVGQSWNNDYSAGDIRVRSDHRVVSRGRIRVGSRSEPVFVVRVAAEVTGANTGTRVDLLWWSPRLSLPVRWKIDMNVGGFAEIRTDADLRLVGLTPAR